MSDWMSNWWRLETGGWEEDWLEPGDWVWEDWECARPAVNRYLLFADAAM